ncbi:MAG: hypothetical protein OXU66_01235 [Gammaproteobacteria bacterium]|nr:hypothetical protein [Gammaproteobacteria bacterium]MDD9895446.1 hypothetical protein [Gammaproteobacteria bacterium]MDD9957538.1 hypothetical protein [Gammaproteobacteria bacterium]
MTLLEVVSECDTVIDKMISRGAAMKEEEKPRHKTLVNSLDLLRERNILLEERDRYSINPEQSALIDYYANSIEHWWK